MSNESKKAVETDERLEDQEVVETDERLEDQEVVEHEEADLTDPAVVTEDGRHEPETVATLTAMLAGLGFGTAIASVLLGMALISAFVVNEQISAAVLCGIGSLIVFLLGLWLGYNRRSVAPFSKLDVLASTAVEMFLIMLAASTLLFLEPIGVDQPAVGTAMAFLGAMIIVSAFAEKLHRNYFALAAMLLSGVVLILMAPPTTWFIPALLVGAVVGLAVGLTCRIPLRNRRRRFIPADDEG